MGFVNSGAEFGGENWDVIWAVVSSAGVPMVTSSVSSGAGFAAVSSASSIADIVCCASFLGPLLQ